MEHAVELLQMFFGSVMIIVNNVLSWNIYGINVGFIFIVGIVVGVISLILWGD